MEVEKALCEGYRVGEEVAFRAYIAVQLGLFVKELVEVQFVHDLQVAALTRCDGFAEEKKYCERNSV